MRLEDDTVGEVEGDVKKGDKDAYIKEKEFMGFPIVSEDSSDNIITEK